MELKDKLAKGQSINAAGESYGGTGVTVIPENNFAPRFSDQRRLFLPPSVPHTGSCLPHWCRRSWGRNLKGIDLDGLTLEQVIKQALKKMVKG